MRTMGVASLALLAWSSAASAEVLGPEKFVAARLQATGDATSGTATPPAAAPAPAAAAPEPTAPPAGMVAPAAETPPPGGVAPAAETPPPGFTPAPVVTEPALAADTYSSYQPPPPSKQGHMAGFMGWAFSVPLGSVRNYAAVVSPLGFELQFQGWVLPNLSIGVSGEWATYVDDRPRTTYESGNSALTATAYNYLQTTSAHLMAHYFFLEDGPVQPYIGPHIGMSWASFSTQIADLILSDTQFSFAWGVEGGVLIPFGYNAPVGLVNVRYSNVPAAEFLGQVTNVQSLSVLLGVGF